MTERRINLYSDTQTKPTPEMRTAMAGAEVGDEQRGEDPTVKLLVERAAELLGKEAALFLPSGTMCNAISLAVHCRAGDEVICEESYHIIGFEGANLPVLSGAMVRPLKGERGLFNREQLQEAIRHPSRYAPRSRVVSLEQTANGGGGTVWPLELVLEISCAAKDAGLLLHMDGARLMNAVVASGVAARDFAEPFDSCWIDLTKGLGCPVGALLAGSKDFIDEAWRWKQRIGGAMRQAGIIAAAGLYALDNHIERLAEDHENAAVLAEALSGIDGIALDPSLV
ncbi:MAG: threonine aldolase family protein, partial [Kiloniellales bacterium]|nr:threonine aldolase family protein [Kiloniellales bacterium]